MQNKILIAAIFFTSFVNHFESTAQDLPVPSPAALVKQTVGLTVLEIGYSSPGVKDRKIFGSLVPFNEMWRTGANKATSLTTSTDITIDGKTLAHGSYAIFTIPGENEWEIIFNGNTEQWGMGNHKDEEDVLKLKVKPSACDFTESMIFFFNDIRDESATINLQWEKTRITIPFGVKVGPQALKNIENALNEANDAFRVYNSAARYYLDENLDAAKALEWAGKSVNLDRRYFNLTTLSRAKAANGMVKEAIKLAGEARQLAVEAKSDHYVKVNDDNLAAWKAKKK